MSPGIPTRLLATQSDERLIALVREGHERAFEALVHRYRKPLSNYCRGLPLPEARVEDVLQQALLKAWLALREGTEVRDLKAWLYRVVHNTAVNTVRSAARDRDRLLEDPTQRVGASEVGLERGLIVRETLAEVAALPQMQREVIVRTAVAGHSHEQVASDLGITDGAVRGLLYRARVTLRTAVTALTPPPLLNWIARATNQGGSASERLANLTAIGGTTSAAGALARGGVAAITAATLVAGAAAVHSQGAAHHGNSSTGVARGTTAGATRADLATAKRAPGITPVDLPARVGRSHGRAVRRAPGHHGGALMTIHLGSAPGSPGAPGRHAPVAQQQAHGLVKDGSPATGQVEPSATPQSASGQSTGQAGGAGQAGGTGQAGGAGQDGAPRQGAGSGGAVGAGPVGSAASDGGSEGSSGVESQGQSSGGASGASSDESGAGGSEGGGASEGSSSPSGSDSQSGSGSSGGSGSQGSDSQGESEASGGAGSGHSGSLVGTVVHEVGSLLEHVLH
jgi:RNA polymerase sigma factor (sigma-70 family)